MRRWLPCQWLLFVLLVVPGMSVCAFCMYYALQDWAVLQQAQEHFRRVATRPTSFNMLFVAEARQNTHRINLFADVVWALLAAVIAAIGLHGMCIAGEIRRIKDMPEAKGTIETR